MEIKTKYEVGDNVWVMTHTQIMRVSIECILIKVFQEQITTIQYKILNRVYDEENIYKTKEELLNAVVNEDICTIYVERDCLGGFKEGEIVWKANFDSISKGKIKIATDWDLAKREYQYAGEIWGDEDCLYRTKEELLKAILV